MSWDGFVYTWNTILIYIDAAITTYWPWLLIAVCLGVFVYTQPVKTRQMLAGLMLAVEKKAVEMALETGQAKMDYVVDQAYALLPPITRLFISKDALRLMAQKLFDEAKDRVRNYEPVIIPPVEPQIPNISPEPTANTSVDSEPAPEDATEPEKAQ